MNSPLPPETPSAPRAARRARSGTRRAAAGGASPDWKDLLWCEWFAQSRLLVGVIAVWLLCVWVLPIFVPPGWVLLLGVFYALLAGPAFGGADVIEGCEEFTLALPTGRSARYLARLAVGGGSLLLLTLLDLTVLGLDLPQAIARFYIDTGLREPTTPRLPWLYGLVAAMPLTLFAIAFTLASLARSRTLVLTSWFWAGLASLALLRTCLVYERFYWGEWNGRVAVPAMLISAAATLTLGYHLYRRKEVGRQAAGPIPGTWWVWMLLIAAGVVLAAALLASLIREFGGLAAPAS